MPRRMPSGSGLNQSAFFAAASSTARCFGVVAQKMPTVEVGIHAGRMRHLVDERFLVEGVLRIVDRAPNAERHRRLLHHIVDQIIRHVVGHLVGEARDERAVDEAHAEARHQAMNERWSGNPHLPCDRHAVRAEPGDQPRHAKGPIVVVFDVLLARPEELDRDIDLFRDQDGLADEFLDGGATPETAAQKRAVDHDLLVRHAGGARRRCQSRHRLLGRHPDLDLAIGDMGGAGLRLHGRMREEWDLIVRLDKLDRALHRCRDIAVGAADLRFFCREVRRERYRRCWRWTRGRCRADPIRSATPRPRAWRATRNSAMTATAFGKRTTRRTPFMSAIAPS